MTISALVTSFVLVQSDCSDGNRGCHLANRPRRGFNQDDIYDAIWIVLGDLLGARLFHMFDHWPDEYASNPIRARYIWEGGLVMGGALVGGLVAGALIAWR